jgi:hypothetical protein
MKPSVYEPVLYHEAPALYLPNWTDATGKGIGPAWTRDGAKGTVSHPALAAGFTTEFPRTRITSTANSDNELGVRLPVAMCYRGSVAPRGGFYFSARFMVNAIPDTAVRMFAGLSAQTGAGVCVSNTIPANTVGLWCGSGDAGNLTVVTADSTGGAVGGGHATATALSAAQTLTAGKLYEFVMIANPAQNQIATQLIDVGIDTLLATQNVSLTMPANTTFVGPQVALSNAAHAAGGDTSLDVISCYLRPNLRLVPLGTP